MDKAIRVLRLLETLPRAPGHAVATGKAMLAPLRDEYLNRFHPHLVRFTEATCTTPDELREDVAPARAQGYADVPQGEWRDGITACACAIPGRSGEPVGAISMSGPDSRIKRKQRTAIAPQVVEAAQPISAALSYSAHV